jgi:hypothetical protein
MESAEPILTPTQPQMSATDNGAAATDFNQMTNTIVHPAYILLYIKVYKGKLADRSN